MRKPEIDETKPILTYGTRGMEPMKLPQFIESLPGILENVPNLEVQIAGAMKLTMVVKKLPGN